MDKQKLSSEELKSLPLFQGLSKASLEILANILTLETYEEDELLFTEGQRGDRFYIVYEGAISLSQNIEGIGSEQIAVCRQGSHFGELAMIDSSPRSTNASAAETSTVVVLHRAALEELMFADPIFAREVLWGFVRELGVRLKEVNEKLRAAYQQNLF